MRLFIVGRGSRVVGAPTPTDLRGIPLLVGDRGSPRRRILPKASDVLAVGEDSDPYRFAGYPFVGRGSRVAEASTPTELDVILDVCALFRCRDSCPRLRRARQCSLRSIAASPTVRLCVI